MQAWVRLLACVSLTPFDRPALCLSRHIGYHRTAPPQVVVSHNELSGKRLKDVHFRQTYGAAVLGIHRQGHPIAGNIADVPLKQGDVLVVEAGPDFHANFKNNRAFSLISEVPKSSPMKRGKMWIALLITVAMVATQVIGGAMGNEVGSASNSAVRQGMQQEQESDRGSPFGLAGC